jgi:copper chaperone CopZ
MLIFVPKKKEMKIKVLSFALLFSVAFVFKSCQEAETEKATVATEVLAENKQEVDMKVEGMVCAMGCAKYIEKEVGEMNGVLASAVNYEEGTARFQFDKSVLSANDIEKFINDIHDGQYSATITVEATSNNIDSNDDSSLKEGKSNEMDEAEEEVEKEVVSLKENLNISFPKLFTYFLKAL